MLLSITVDRYVFIKQPLRYHPIVTSRRVKAVLSAICLAAAVQIPIVPTYSKRQPKPENNRSKELNLFLLSILIVVIAILNYKILKIVKQRKWKTQRNVVNPEQAEPEEMQQQHDVAWLRQLLKQMRAIKTFTIISGVLTVYFVLYFEVVYINSIANDFIYALRHGMYLKAYKKLFSVF